MALSSILRVGNRLSRCQLTHGLPLILALIFAWPSLRLLGLTYWNNPDYGHGLLVVPIAIFFAREHLRQKPELTPAPSMLAIPLLLLAILGILAAHWHELALLPPASLGTEFGLGIGTILLITALCLGSGGRGFTRRIGFSLLFLLLAVPIPASLTDPLTLPLRRLASYCAALALRAFDTPVFCEGTVLHLPHATLNAEDACSGMRSLFAMLATGAALCAHFRFKSYRAILMVAFSVVVAILVNLSRTALLGLLIVKHGERYASGWRHDLCGWSAFAAGLMLEIGFALLLRRLRFLSPPKRDHTPHKQPSVRAARNNTRQHTCVGGLMAGLLCLAIIAQFTVTKHYTAMPVTGRARQRFERFPDRIGRYQISTTRHLDENEIDVLQPTDMLSRSYTAGGGQELHLRLLYWESRQTRSAQVATGLEGPHSPDGCFPAHGWRRQRALDDDITIGGIRYQLRVYTRGAEKRVLLYAMEGGWRPLRIADYPRAIATRWQTMLASWRRPRIIQPAQYIIVLEMGSRHDVEQMQADLRAFAEALTPFLPQYGLYTPSSPTDEDTRSYNSHTFQPL